MSEVSYDGVTVYTSHIPATVHRVVDSAGDAWLRLFHDDWQCELLPGLVVSEAVLLAEYEPVTDCGLAVTA